MILEKLKCDRAGCEEESPDLAQGTVPLGWVCVSRWGVDEEEDQVLHYCGWDCALFGVNEQYDQAQKTEAGL